MYMIYCKYCKYMIIILSHFFITTADYQFSKVPTKPTKQSACAKSLFIVFSNNRMIFIKWTIILEFGKRLFLLALKDFACVPFCGNDEDVTTYEGPPKFNSYF